MRPANIVFLMFFLFDQAQAKWIEKLDAPIKNSYHEKIYINKNGTYEKLNEIDREILTEVGRNSSSNIVLYYNGDNEKIKILSAETITHGKKYYLDKKLLEDKPLASSYNGFDQSRQIMLAFPNVAIGSKLYLKYKIIQKQPNLDNFFAETFYFGNRELVTKSNIKIFSKLPLHTLINDPNKALEVKKTKLKNLYAIEITLNKDIYNDVIYEPAPIIINEKHLTWVSVSTIKDWNEFAAKHGGYYAKILNQKLPNDFEQIANIANKKDKEIDKIDTVTDLLSRKIRYMGDWRSINGRLIARDLAKIDKSQLGDCKDFAVSLAAILNKVGFKSQVAFVARGVDILSKHILPSFDAFNHAIVKTIGRSGIVYWIDPTNFESMAGKIFPDIADKMSLVLDPKQPSYEKIPDINPLEPEMEIKRKLEILNNEIIETGQLFLRNQEALGITGGELKVSVKNIKNAVFYLLADGINIDDKNKIKMVLPKLNSRIVKDVVVDYSFKRENDILKTNLGLALKLNTVVSLSEIYNISQDYAAEALIKISPATFKRETTIKNVVVQNIEFLNKEIKTPWLYIKRKCQLDSNHDLVINDLIILYKKLIPSEDFKNLTFIELKKYLNDNFKDIIIMFKLRGSGVNHYFAPTTIKRLKVS